jgi:hypothetical protein
MLIRRAPLGYTRFHLVEDANRAHASVLAKNLVRPQSSQTTTLNFSALQNLPRPGR